MLTSEFLNKPAYVGPFAKAMICAWRGENDDAFHHLEADPRYPVFLEKPGLLEAWKMMPRE